MSLERVDCDEWPMSYRVLAPDEERRTQAELTNPTETIESSDTSEVREETEETSVQAPSEGAQGGTLRGGMNASEMARRRWAKERERQAQAVDGDDETAHGNDVALVRVTVQTGSIMRKLAQDAKKGDVSAARELRSWLAEVAVAADTQVTDLDRKTRSAVLAVLLDDDVLPLLMDETIRSSMIEHGRALAGAAEEGPTPANDGTPVG